MIKEMRKQQDADFLFFNILSAFNETGEPFAVIGSTLYNIVPYTDSAGTKGTVSLSGLVLGLEEGEDLACIERRLLESGRPQVEGLISRHVKQVLDKKYNDCNNEIRKAREDYLKALDQKDTPEWFITGRVFPLLSCVRPERQNGQNRTRNAPAIPDFRPAVPNRPDAFITLINSPEAFRSLYSDQGDNSGFACLNRNCYALKRVQEADSQDNLSETVALGEARWRAQYWQSLETLSKRYSDLIKERITDTGKRLAASLEKSIEEEARKAIGGFVLPKASGTQAKRRIGPASFKKRSRGNYTIALDIPDFIIKKGDRYYHFRPLSLGLDLAFSNDRLTISNPARILASDYRHMFRSSYSERDYNICYGDFSFRNCGVSFGSPVEYKRNPGRAAAQVSELFRAGRNVIERGYRGVPNKDFFPHALIENCAPLVAKGQRQAEEYARKARIPYSRIIDNR